MIKKTVEISRESAHLSVARKQLLLQRDGETVGSIPCEDLGMVLVDHPAVTYSHAALSALLESDAVLVVCGRDHLPQGMLVPFSEHKEVVSRLHDQISASQPLRKQLWRQIVRAKIDAQAANLPIGSVPRRKLERLASEVRSGDSANHEAQAAKIYWASWLDYPDREVDASPEAFRRLREGMAPNNLLNYGYAVVRAAVARSLVSSGLHPALGLHHHNRSNPFCLADDLMEPLRPLVDRVVRELYWSGEIELDARTKPVLLELLTEEVSTGEKSGPLMVQLHSYTSSLARCLAGETRQLEIPRPCRSADTVTCG